MKPVFLITVAVCAVITVAVALIIVIRKLPNLTRFMIVVMSPILLAFYWQLPLLVNILIDTLFFVFLRELYKVETNPLKLEEEKNDLYERLDGDDYAELVDIEGIDWSMTRV